MIYACLCGQPLVFAPPAVVLDPYSRNRYY